jgi:LysM repeat protein
MLLLVVVGCPKKQAPSAHVGEAEPPVQPMQSLTPEDSAAVRPAALPRPVETSVAPRPVEGAGGTYTVQKGDTFYGISRKLFGDNSKAKEIQAMNPGLDPTKLKVGQVINVPEK